VVPQIWGPREEKVIRGKGESAINGGRKYVPGGGVQTGRGGFNLARKKSRMKPALAGGTCASTVGEGNIRFKTAGGDRK